MITDDELIESIMDELEDCDDYYTILKGFIFKAREGYVKGTDFSEEFGLLRDAIKQGKPALPCLDAFYEEIIRLVGE